MTRNEAHELAVILEELRNEFVKAAGEKNDYKLDVAMDTACEEMQALFQKIICRIIKVVDNRIV